MAESLIGPEARAMIGATSEPEKMLFPITREMVYELADAIEDPNPLYRDEEYAQKSRFGGLICPPLALWRQWAPPIDEYGAGQDRSHLEVPLPLTRYGLNGGSEWEFYRPAYVGDEVTRRQRIADIYEKEGRSGRMVFIIREVTYENQRGEPICRARKIQIRR